MFNIFRRPDSINLYIEFIDAALEYDKKEVASEIYRGIVDFLTKEYLEKNKTELVGAISKQTVIDALAKNIAEKLLTSEKS